MKQISSVIIQSLPLWAVSFITAVYEVWAWRGRKFAAPTPAFVKRAIFKRLGIPGGTWVETGTYLGQTTNFLAGLSKHVYTIELDNSLAERAKKKFKNRNITVIEGASEDVLEPILKRLDGDINFWLDGHYSGGFTAKGKQDCPVLAELESIGRYLHQFGRVTVLIDDLRCFGSGSYPHTNQLVQWSEKCGLAWSIEQDIFVMQKPEPKLS